MSGFEGILFDAILLAFLAGVFALIYKGSRPPQPSPARGWRWGENW